jgi:hypothetical protein
LLRCTAGDGRGVGVRDYRTTDNVVHLLLGHGKDRVGTEARSVDNQNAARKGAP